MPLGAPQACIPNRAVLLFASQVLGSLLKHGHMPCTAENVGALQERCRDPAVSVCKQALHSITELLQVRRGHGNSAQPGWGKAGGTVPIGCSLGELRSVTPS